MQPPAKVGYFIWCWNDQEWLNECLTTFRATTKDIYLVGILNASTDSSDLIYWEHCDLVMYNHESQSVSACVNKGYQILYDAGCEYLGFIHPDMKFEQQGWVDTLVRTLDTYPHIGRISPWNISRDDLTVGFIHPGMEAGCLMRRESWTNIGPFDEAFIGCGGYEDWDMQRRFIAKGLANCVTPEARVWHRHAGTREKIDHAERHVMWIHNQYVYATKWNTYENAMAPDGWQDIHLA